MTNARHAKPVDSAASSWRWIFKVVIGILLFVWVFQSQITPAGAGGHGHSHEHDHHDHIHDHHGHSHDHHGHSHEHSDEPPSFKYSRQANENVKQKQVHSKDNVPTSSTPKKVVVEHETPKSRSIPEKNPNLWVEAIGSTLLISAAPFFILFLIPLDNSKEKRHFLKVLLSFASGGLLGDAFLHLIPHAIMAVEEADGHHHGHGHSHGHSHGAGEDHHAHDISVGLWVLVGIVTFLIVEKLIRIMKGGHHHSHGSDHDEKSSDHEEEKTAQSTDETQKSPKGKKESKQVKSKPKKQKASKESEDSEIQVSGYLNLAADFTHNFTDGLAIGASYLAGRTVGMVTTVTILLHEVPHEIGDFAILIQSGCTKKKAMMLQLITALGAVSGTIMSLLAEGVGDAAIAWILPFTAGGFIYIATVSVIPELLQQSTFKQSVKEIIALFAGIYMMVLIGKFE